MAYTTMKTWASLTVLTASEMNTYLRDNIEYLKAGLDGLTGSGVHLARSTPQTIPTASGTYADFDLVGFELGHDWWTSGATVTVPAGAIPAGYTNILVIILARVQWAVNGTGSRRLRTHVNAVTVGSQVVGALSGEVTDQILTGFASVAAGDAIKAEVYQTSGGNLDANVLELDVIRLFPVA